jgi:hypothetical protein
MPDRDSGNHENVAIAVSAAEASWAAGVSPLQAAAPEAVQRQDAAAGQVVRRQDAAARQRDEVPVSSPRLWRALGASELGF